NDPDKRTQWMHERTWSAGERPAGRTAIGAKNHCAHGKNTITETIVDWKPFHYVTSRQEGAGVRLMETIRLDALPSGKGTRIQDTIRFESTLPGWLRRRLFAFMTTRVVQYKNEEIFETLARLMAATSQPAAESVERA